MAEAEVLSISELRQKAEKMVRGAAKLIILKLTARGLRPITPPMLETLNTFRVLARRFPGGRVPVDEAYDTCGRRSMGGLMLRGLLRYHYDSRTSQVFMEQKEPDE